MVVGVARPELTLVFDLPVEVGLARAIARGGAEQRFERKGEAFHQRLREGFLAIAEAEPQRCRVINADDDMDGVAAAVWASVSAHFGVDELS